MTLAQLRSAAIASIDDCLTLAEAEDMIASIDDHLAAGVDADLELEGPIIDLDGPLPARRAFVQVKCGGLLWLVPRDTLPES